MLVDLLLSKHYHNGAAARRFLLVLGAAFDACKLRVCVAGFRILLGALLPLLWRRKYGVDHKQAIFADDLNRVSFGDLGK